VPKKPSGLGNVIDQLLVSLGQGRKYHGWRMVELWPEIVGPEIAVISRAVGYSEGVLTVVVKQDAWRQELEMQLEHILRKIHATAGGDAVEKIVLRAGSALEKTNE